MSKNKAAAKPHILVWLGGGAKKVLSAVGHFIKKHKIISFLLLVAIVAGGWFGWQALAVNSAGSAAVVYSFIRTTTLTKGSLDSTVSTTGTVGSSDTSTVSYSSGGSSASAPKIKTVNVAVGDTVAAGDVIVTLDTSDIQDSITKEKENIAEQTEKAQTSYDDAVASYNEAVSTAENYESTVSSALAAYNSAAAALAPAKNSIAGYQSTYDTAAANLLAAGTALNNAGLASYSVSDEAAIANFRAALQGALDSANGELTSAQDAQATAQAGYDTASAAAAASPDDAALAAAAAAAGTALTDAQNAVAAAQSTQAAAQKNCDLICAYQEAYKAAGNAKKILETAKSNSNYDELEKTCSSTQQAYTQARTQLDNYEKQVTTAKKAVDSAKETLEKAGSSDALETLEEQLAACSLTAETAGKVTSLSASVGAAPGGTIATIQNTDSLKVSITIEEADINSVAVGMTCTITSDATEGSILGTLTQIDPVSSQNGSFGAEVTVTSENTGLLIGMNATVDILLSSTADCFMVPIDAVDTDDTGSFVYRKTGGTGTDMTFEKVYVTTGDTNDYYIEVSGADLAEGDVIRSSADLAQGAEETTDAAAAGLDFGAMFGGGNAGGMGGNMGGGNGTRSERPSGMGGGNMPSGAAPGGNG